MKRPIQSVSVAALLALAGCASTGSEHEPDRAPLDDSVARIAEELVRTAEQRADLSAMRVYVHEVSEDASEAQFGQRVFVDAREVSAVQHRLERELMVALSGRMHILDVDLAGGTLPEKGSSLAQMAERFDATHALVGSFAERDDELEVSVRLVEARTLLIVAAARGAVPYEPLVHPLRVAAEPIPVRVSEPHRSIGSAPPLEVLDAAAEEAGSRTSLAKKMEQMTPPPGTAPIVGSSSRLDKTRERIADAQKQLGEEPADESRVNLPEASAPPRDNVSIREIVGLDNLPEPQGPAAYRMRSVGRPIVKSKE